MKSEIQKRLEQLALKRSNAFCYSCYHTVTQSHCPTCGSDDLMRETTDGVEYGLDWVIKNILEAELKAVNLEAAFEQFVRECYPDTTQVGWMAFDTVSLMKNQDPVSWHCALADYESQEAGEGNIISFDNGNTYYCISDIEKLLEQD